MKHFLHDVVKVHQQSKNKGALYGGDLYWLTGLDLEKTEEVRVG